MADKEISLKLSFKNLTKGEIDEVRRGIAGIGEDIGGTQRKGDALKFAFAGWANEAVKFAKNGLLAIADAAKQVAEGLAQIALDGSKSADIEDAFMRMARAVGIDGVQAIEALEDATAHLIDNTDLMRESQKLMSAGMTPTIEQLRTMGEAARVLSKSTGTDMADAFKVVSDAMLTGRTRALSMMGVLVDTKEATDDLAEAAKEAGVQVDTAAQIESKRQAVLVSLNKLVKDAGVQHLSLAERVQQGRVAWGNFLDDLGMAIARSPVLAAGLEAVSTAIQNAFGDKKGDLIKTIAGLIDDFAISLVKGARTAVTFAKVVGEAFFAAKASIEFMAASSILAMVKLIDTMHALTLTAELLPGAAKVVGFVGGAVTAPLVAQRNTLKAIGDDLMKGATNAAVGFTTWREGANKVDEALAKVVESMEAARGKGVDVQTMAERTGAALGNNLAAGAERSKKLLAELRKEFEQFTRSTVNRGPADVSELFGLPRFGRPPAISTPVRFEEGWLQAPLPITAANPAALMAMMGGGFGLDGRPKPPPLFERLLGPGFAGALSGNVLSALSGGGSVSRTVGGTALSSLLGSKQGLGGLIGTGLSKLGPTIGGALGSVIPGLGTIVGGALGGLVGKLFGPSKTQLAGREADTQIDALRAKLVGPQGLFGTFEQLQAAALEVGVTFSDVWGRRGVDGLSLLTTRIGEFEQKQQAVKTLQDQLGGGIGRLTGSLQAFGGVVPAALRPLVEGLMTSKNLTAEMRGVLQDVTKDPSWQTMQARAEALGIKLSSLGSEFSQARLGDIALGYARDLAMFADAGADMNGVLEGMQDELSDLAEEAIATKSILPETLRPYMQALSDTGRLLDDNGEKIDLNQVKFGDIKDEALQDIVDVLEEIKDLLANALPAAAREGARGISDALTNLPPVEVDVRVRQPHIYAQTEDGGPPVFDTPVRRITRSGWGWLNPGDVAGMPHLTPGMNAAPVNVTFNVNAVDADSVRNWFRRTGVRELTEVLRTSGLARQQFTAAMGA